MADSAMISNVRQKYEALAPLLHEKARRCWAASEALSLGRGGISLVAAATDLSRPMIRRGIAELQAGDHGLGDDHPGPTRIRRPGGGRHSISATDRTLLEDLKRLIDPVTRGDPLSPLLWTCKSTRNLADALLAGIRSEPSDRGRWTTWPQQPPGQPQDRGGPRPPGSQRPVRAHQRQGPLVPAAGSAGGLGGYQEEGNRREL